MTTTETGTLPFHNPDLPLKERTADLISRLTLEEKIVLMSQYQADIPRLDIAKYKHGTEGAHGVAWLGEATVFPQNIGLAATWDPELMKQVGEAIGNEARVYYQRNPEINGLTVWAPTVDMERDPRWGRTEEAYGEDPYLVGCLTSSLVKGMQGDDPFYYRVVATLKHFYANNNEKERGFCSASIDPRNKREYYLKAFEPAFREGGAASMMTAYNSVNGVPCNLSPDMQAIVRDEWGMSGFIVSDAGDVLGTVNDHGETASYADAVARSIRSGIDSITDDSETVHRAIRDALEQGLLVEEDLDGALARTFGVRIRLGEFDAGRNPYAGVPDAMLCAPEHARLALRAAQQAIVLLRNEPAAGSDKPLLPLNPAEAGRVAVIGPLADEAFTDWYSGTPAYRVTPLQGIANRLGAGTYVSGADKVRLRSLDTGRYVGRGEELRLNAEDAGEAEVFELTDWGYGSLTLRALSNGKLVTDAEEGLNASAAEARGWFVKEAFGLSRQADGSHRLLTWNGKPIGSTEEGRLMPASTEASKPVNAGDAANPGAAEEAARAERERLRRLPQRAERFEVELVSSGLDEAAATAAAADTVVVIVGNQPFINGKEDADRPGLALPPAQQALIRAAAAANPRTAVVLVSSYANALEGTENAVPALLQTSHGGQEHGNAVAGALFGEFSPAGRLPMTWYRSEEGLPSIMDYDIIRGGRTYQYWPGDVLYPFGHGLTYGEFRYGDAVLDRDAIREGEAAAIVVEVTNEGAVDSDEVVQLYVRVEGSRVPRPLRKLADFRRIRIAAGETKRVTLTLRAEELAAWDVTRERFALENGRCRIMIGRSSGDIRSTAELRIAGEDIPLRELGGRVKAVNFDDCEGAIVDRYADGGDSIRMQGGTGWLLYRGAALPEGAARFEARVAGPAAGGTVELRLGGPSGPLAAAVPVPRTGGPQAWTTVSAALELPQGENGKAGRDVALVVRGDARIAAFSLRGADAAQ